MALSTSALIMPALSRAICPEARFAALPGKAAARPRAQRRKARSTVGSMVRCSRSCASRMRLQSRS